MNTRLIAFTVLAVILLLAGNPHVSLAAGKYTINNPPRVPYKYALGMKKYGALCSRCHGKWGNGTRQGPPLMHGFYKPSHHGDPAFYRAALKGVRAHHWQFGNMPPVPGATRKDIDAIIPFIRWLQRENGIY
ncbi:MAG TPA: cytochrome c [Gammaproteobacteria bacterium]|nr:cytochrome c [Gammaproteobacteria bacterium]